MCDLVEEISTKYQTRSNYNINIDENNKIEYTRKSNYRIQKAIITSFGTFSGLGSKILDFIPDELKKIQSLDVFQDMIKNIKFASVLAIFVENM